MKSNTLFQNKAEEEYLEQNCASPPSTVIGGILRPPDAEGSRRRAQEVHGRADQRGARASAEADPLGRGPRTDAQPRPYLAQSRRGRGARARRPRDRPHAGDLLGHRGAGARAVLAPGARRRARTLHARSGLRANLRRPGRGALGRSCVLRGAAGAGSLEHAAVGGQGGGARHRGERLPRDGSQGAQKTSCGPISSRGG